MQIILWRHAEAEDLAPSDLARNLTLKGRKHAESMATWLRKQLHDDFGNWRVIASPANRAQQTAAALQMKFETIDSLAPDAAPESILNAARWPDSSFNVIVIGHQPTLGMVAARLMNGVDGYVAVKKGATWWFETRERNGRVETVMKAMTTPESFG